MKLSLYGPDVPETLAKSLLLAWTRGIVAGAGLAVDGLLLAPGYLGYIYLSYSLISSSSFFLRLGDGDPSFLLIEIGFSLMRLPCLTNKGYSLDSS